MLRNALNLVVIVLAILTLFFHFKWVNSDITSWEPLAAISSLVMSLIMGYTAWRFNNARTAKNELSSSEKILSNEEIPCGQNNLNAKTEIVINDTVRAKNNNTVAMNKISVLSLIDEDIDEAFIELDKVFLGKNATYKDLSKEYFEQPNNFSMATFRSKLKRFVNTEWK